MMGQMQTLDSDVTTRLIERPRWRRDALRARWIASSV